MRGSRRLDLRVYAAAGTVLRREVVAADDALSVVLGVLVVAQSELDVVDHVGSPHRACLAYVLQYNTPHIICVAF